MKIRGGTMGSSFGRAESHRFRNRTVGFWLCTLLVAVLGLGWSCCEAGPKDKPRNAKRRASEEAETPASGPDFGETATGSTSSTESGGATTLRDAIDFAIESREVVRELKDYTARFVKFERIGNNLVHQEMDMKFRAKPFSVYFLYQSQKEQGRQAIFVEGRNNNNLLVKEAKGLAGAVGVVPLRLDDHRVKKENLYPVTQVGIANMLEETIKEWEHDLKVPGDQVEVLFYPNAKVEGQPCQAIEVTHLKRMKEIRFWRNRIYFDRETRIPIRGERYGWARSAGEKAPLMEDYKYLNLRTNVNLTDADFTTRKYGF
ncbi:MAG: DUF1571 domain-containing protein [Planctomycetes bacterium]|nr:DUF1571 domain-containing protein [Planctomycetota bacterium]